VQLAFAMPNVAAIPLTAGQEYYDFKMLLLNTKTVGTGSCSGCDVAAAIGLTYLEVDQVTGTGPNVIMSGPQYITDRSTAGWQCPAAFSWTCDGAGCSFDLHPTCATPALRSTWGAIKAFYR
jgi:hypothetical protein